MDKLLLAEQLRLVPGSEILGKMQNGRSWSLPSTPKPQNYAGNEVLAFFFLIKKKTFFFKNKISQYFRDFSTHQSKDFRDLGDPGVCPYLGQRNPTTCLAILENKNKFFV